MIPPSETSRVYPSIKYEIKRNLEKGTANKRATHNTLKKFGSINAAPPASQVPTISQVSETLVVISAFQVPREDLKEQRGYFLTQCLPQGTLKYLKHL